MARVAIHAATVFSTLVSLIGPTGGEYSSDNLSSISYSRSSTGPTRAPVADVSCTELSASQTADHWPRRVNIPPLITLDLPRVVYFRENETIELWCVASGVPRPNYRWTFNDAPFDPRDNDGRITLYPGLARLFAPDEGYYQCHAYNVAGTAVSAKANLRQAVLQPFPENDPYNPRRHIVNLGMPLTLRCSLPNSVPNAGVFWAISSDDNRFLPIDYSDRIVQDLDGNLHFVNVQPEDNNNGATYACFATNNATHPSIQHGEYIKIYVQEVALQYYPPAIIWQSPSWQLALRGSTLSIKCIFSGSPTPRVTWIRTDGVLPANARVESFGLTLTFDDVHYADAGSYECRGINDEAIVPVRISYTLSVESAPYWIEKPVSAVVAENESVIFGCRCEGIPEPEYFWFINGIPLTKLPPDSRRRVSTNAIVFYNVTTKDVQVIQCNATNKHGYNFTNAYLNVYSEPPFIVRGPAIGFKAAEGQTINLACGVHGSPKPLVVWKRRDEKITGGRFVVLEDGSLQITDLSLGDTGTYTCTATNRLGYVEAAGTLLVRRKTQLVTAPSDVTLPKGRDARFTCTGTTDPEEVHSLKIQWKKNGHIINCRLDHRIFHNVIDNSLTISGSAFSDSGKYTCVATNGIDWSEATAELVVQDVPDPPVSLHARCHSSTRSAELWWRPGLDNHARILRFVLQYNTSFQPDVWHNIATDIPYNKHPSSDWRSKSDYIKDRTVGSMYPCEHNTCRLVVWMSPWANYTFRVIAGNMVGYSPPRFQSLVVCTTEPDMPDKNPPNVIGEGDQPGNLVIFWTPMPKIEQNGRDFKYIVAYRRADIPTATDTIAIIRNPDAWCYEVPDGNMGIYKPYRITVKASNERGDSRAPLVPVIGHSGEDVPLVRPMDVQVYQNSITPTSVRLYWANIDTSPDKIRGFFRGYKIQFAKEGDEWNNSLFREQDVILSKSQYPRKRMKRQIIPFDSRTMTQVYLNKLPPYSIINIQIRVLTKYYAGPPSAHVQIATPEGVPGPPKSLSVSVVGATHFVLKWIHPDEPNGQIVGYQLYYQTETNLQLGPLLYRDKLYDPNATSDRLTGLKANTTYRVYLAAFTNAGRGEPIFIDATTALSGPNRRSNKSVSRYLNEVWICLLFIAAFLVLLLVAKKVADRTWREKETLIEKQARQRQAEEAARQMGVFDQDVDSGTDETARLKPPENVPMDVHDYDTGAACAQPAKGSQNLSGTSMSKYSPVPEGYSGACIFSAGRAGTSSTTSV